MKTVIEMAVNAGIEITYEYEDGDLELSGDKKALERFAEIVRADEREKYKWDIHSCGPTCKRYACVAMREAVEAENEACAKLCDELHPGLSTKRAAEHIRARRKT